MYLVAVSSRSILCEQDAFTESVPSGNGTNLITCCTKGKTRGHLSCKGCPNGVLTKAFALQNSASLFPCQFGSARAYSFNPHPRVLHFLFPH